MTDGPSSYKPGDVVNGYVLTADMQWVPVSPPQFPASGNQPIYVVQPDNSNNTSLAPVTSLVSGLIGLFFSWIPFIGIVGWVFGPLALVFGFLGLGRGKAEHKVMSWIGIVCGAITVVICLLYVIAFVMSFGASDAY